MVTLRKARMLWRVLGRCDDGASRNGRPSVPDVRPLVLAAGAVSALAALGVVPLWPGLAHHVALPPLDLFADVRGLMAEAPS